jgi:hypothetical protein
LIPLTRGFSFKGFSPTLKSHRPRPPRFSFSQTAREFNDKLPDGCVQIAMTDATVEVASGKGEPRARREATPRPILPSKHDISGERIFGETLHRSELFPHILSQCIAEAQVMSNKM